MTDLRPTYMHKAFISSHFEYGTPIAAHPSCEQDFFKDLVKTLQDCLGTGLILGLLGCFLQLLLETEHKNLLLSRGHLEVWKTKL